MQHPASHTRERHSTTSPAGPQQTPVNHSREQHAAANHVREQRVPANQTREHNPLASQTREHHPVADQSREQNVASNRVREQQIPPNATREQGSRPNASVSRLRDIIHRHHVPTNEMRDAGSRQHFQGSEGIKHNSNNNQLGVKADATVKTGIIFILNSKRMYFLLRSMHHCLKTKKIKYQERFKLPPINGHSHFIVKRCKMRHNISGRRVDCVDT